MKYLSFLILFVCSLVYAGPSTINATIPAANSALQSGPIRGNFQAAQNDINNLIEQNFGISAPIDPIEGQMWINTTSIPFTWNVYDGVQWDELGTINASTGLAQAYSIKWSGVTNTPTTLAGYGITNAVSSVSLTMPNIFSVTGSPVTGTGTFVATFNNQAQGLVLASPATSTGAPTFRALVATDLPGAYATYPGAGIPNSTGSAWGTSYGTTGTGNVVLSASPSLTGVPTAPTDPFAYDSTTQIATEAFVNNAIQFTMATLPINVAADTVGTISFDSVGAPAAVLRVTTVSSGSITAATVLTGGGSTTAFKVGDVLGCKQTGSTGDALLQVATVSTGAVATVNVLYGGTAGYTASTGCSASPFVASIPFTFTLSGMLPQSETYITTYGTVLTQSNQWIVNNNTTGAYSVTFKVGTASDTATGTGIVIPQGTNNGAFIETDGSSDVWCVAGSCAANLGIPTAINLTNGTGLPISTGVSGLGTGVATALASNVNASGGILSATTPPLSAETFSTSSTVTAGTNSQGQGALTSDYNVVTTTAANPSGVTLPTATIGRKIIVINKGTNSINIYPASSSYIDSIAINSPISLPVGMGIEFNADTTTQWYSTLNYASNFIIGLTPITSGNNGYLIYNNNGIAGNEAVSSITTGASTNIAGGTAGQIPYQSGVGATGFSGPCAGGTYLGGAGTSAPACVLSIPYVGAGGTSDAITATYSPVITTLTDGETLSFGPTAANTTTSPTFQANSTTAYTIYKNNKAPLIVGDIPGSNAQMILQYSAGGGSPYFILINPAVAASATVASTATTVTTNANLTGPITSIGNTTAVASQTGTGSVFAMQASPTLTTPTFNGYTEGTCTPTVTSNAITITVTSVATGCSTISTMQKVVMTANTAITLPAPSTGISYSLLVCASGGAYSPTFSMASGTLSWSGGTAPTATATNGHCDAYSFTNFGTSYTLGWAVLNFVD